MRPGEPAFGANSDKRATARYELLRAPVHLARRFGAPAQHGLGCFGVLSAVREGKLWELVACHHDNPNVLSKHARGAGEILVRQLDLQVEIKEEAQRKTYVD